MERNLQFDGKHGIASHLTATVIAIPSLFKIRWASAEYWRITSPTAGEIGRPEYNGSFRST